MESGTYDMESGTYDMAQAAGARLDQARADAARANKQMVSTAPSPAAPVSPIHAALVDQQQELQVLHGLLNHLEERLGSVLAHAQAPPGLVGVSEKDRTMIGAQVVDRIAGGNMVIRMAQGRIRELLDRLEL